MDKHYIFQTQGVCAQEISFDIIDGHLFMSASRVAAEAIPRV